ncbi:peptidoglycan DD-metalloendopeptidase family protein [Arthrobacter sp. Z1-15]
MLQNIKTSPTCVWLPRRTRILAALRWPITALTLTLVLIVLVWDMLPEGPQALQITHSLLSLLVLLLVITMIGITRWGAGPKRDAFEVKMPVDGRWKIISSPAERIPSHGTHVFGQGWAVDMLCAPPNTEPVPFRTVGGPLPADHFPSFGQPIKAGVHGTVVVARDAARDHGSQNSWLLLPLFFIESFLRGVGGERLIFGNLLVIALEDNPYLALAQLQRGSITVRVGDKVSPQDLVARCGNSGSSSEPHLHLQMMDRPSPTFAAGIPLSFTDGMAAVPMPKRNQMLISQRDTGPS